MILVVIRLYLQLHHGDACQAYRHASDDAATCIAQSCVSDYAPVLRYLAQACARQGRK